MKIVYINDNDLLGRRFNGYDLQTMLLQRGYDAKQLVIAKNSDNENVCPIIKTPGAHYVRKKCREFEEKMSIQSLIYPFGELILKNEYFLNADIAHFHLIFNHFMSIYSLKKLAEAKPTVWTLHDPWALTGHCVHPIDCKGWLSGCQNCPYLDRYSPLTEDYASALWNIKKDVYKKMDIDIIVASQWMYKMVTESPLTRHFERVHIIPFGIDLDLFKRKENRINVRADLGIDKKEFVIMFRQDDQEFKGFTYIKEMLKKLSSNLRIVLLTVGKTGLLKEFGKKYKIIEYEWIDDNRFLSDLYSASDLFLMPSVAESFGLMSVEAMASSLPIIIFKGTALPGVTFAPDCGIELDRGDTKELVNTVTRMVNSPKECLERGERGRIIAEDNYNIEEYNNKIINLYNKIYSKNKKK